MNPQFVMVIGGSGSGKNYYISRHPTYRSYKLLDVDEFRAASERSISNITPALKSALSSGVNIAHPTTGAGSIQAILNKLKMAKDAGYETTLVFIDTPPEQAAKNVKKRAAGGGHDVPDWKIEKTNEISRLNYETVKDNPLVDRTDIVQSGTQTEILRKMIRVTIQSILR
jgi:predicted ABC-type ATPase